MIIKTKYNIGDKVWFGSLGFSKSATISEIKIYVMIDGEIRIEYYIENNGYCWQRNEHEIFHTKEELLKSL
jgi:hypothetical protein